VTEEVYTDIFNLLFHWHSGPHTDKMRWHFVVEISLYPVSFFSLTLSCRDLNASCSGCLPKFFLGFFKFQCMLLEKKLYLTDFSFKFNETKFCTLLMNWSIQEKIFTYFYNKFRPLNRMHYIKCGVNSSSLT